VRGITTALRGLGVVLAFALLGRWLAAGRWSPVSRYVVEGPSMEPAFRNGDRLLVNRLAYRSKAPRPGDVIVLRDPGDRHRFLLKRVATAPDPVEASAGSVYVLGDNEAFSRDSRAFGAVARADVVGRAWFRY
jgi:signal peptidase I